MNWPVVLDSAALAAFGLGLAAVILVTLHGVTCVVGAGARRLRDRIGR